jgi:intracellular multiplication protein IcmT
MDVHWRNSMKPARFFFLDARAAWPFLFALLYLRIWTVALAALTTVVFYLLEMRGLTFDAALRAFRVWIVTKKRPGIRHSDLPREIDFAFEGLPEKYVNEGSPPSQTTHKKPISKPTPTPKTPVSKAKTASSPPRRGTSGK